MSKDPKTGQFQPGESGNLQRMFKPGGPPGPGRPKSTQSIVAGMRDKLDQPAVLGVDPKTKQPRFVYDPVSKEQMTWRDFFVDRLFVNAGRGNARATMEILDRIDGKVKQTVALEGTEGGPPISVSDARADLIAALAQIKPRKTKRKRQAKPGKKASS